MTIEESEEHVVAKALGEILTSTMLRAYEEPNGGRRFLYIWEREGLRWLLRYSMRHPDCANVGNAWMSTFLKLNERSINTDAGLMDFNLRAFDQREG